MKTTCAFLGIFEKVHFRFSLFITGGRFLITSEEIAKNGFKGIIK